MVTTTIMMNAITMPGTIPAMNKAPTDAPDTVAYTTSGMLGGMIGPSVEEAAVTQHEKSLSNPFSFMALISMAPSPPASDTAVPDIPAKITLDRIFTWPRPPGSQPTTFIQNANSFLVIPPVFISLAARRNRGIASRVNELVPVYRYWLSILHFIPVVAIIKAQPVRAMLIYTGTFNRNRASMQIRITIIISFICPGQPPFLPAKPFLLLLR